MVSQMHDAYYIAHNKKPFKNQYENWLAKPFYEQYMPIAEKEGVDKNKKDLIDAYTYMGVYFNTKKEVCKAKEYFKKVFDLDANNVNAKKFLESEGAKKCQ